MSYRKHLMPSNIAPSAVYEATAVDPDTDTISRKAAITAIDNCGCDGKDSCGEPWIYKENAVEAIEMVEPLPPAEPERIRGRWIYNGVKFPNFDGQIVSEAICTECKGISYFRRVFDKYIGANVCPNCGADMRGEQNEP